MYTSLARLLGTLYFKDELNKSIFVIYVQGAHPLYRIFNVKKLEFGFAVVRSNYNLVR